MIHRIEGILIKYMGTLSQCAEVNKFFFKPCAHAQAHSLGSASVAAKSLVKIAGTCEM